MLKLIANAQVYDPEPRGRVSLLLIGDTIARIGDIEPGPLEASGLGLEVVDATGCIVTPGLIDPHVHLIGGGGEGGFSTRTPEVQLSKIILAGVTTVVGCLGTDGTTRHMTSLLAKARGLEEEGVSTYIYTGNYHFPPPTITGAVRDDLIIVDKVVGAGEIAISDHRSSQPSFEEVARLVAEARVGGLLSGKAGVTHFHVGSGKRQLDLLHKLLEETELPPSNLYVTHVTRSKTLFDDAIWLTKQGGFADITADEETGRWLSYYLDNGGPAGQLTVSSDGNGSLPHFDEAGRLVSLRAASIGALLEQLVAAVKVHNLPLSQILPFFTSNAADALRLKHKGRLQEKADADVLIMREDTLALVHLFAKGRQMVKDGQPMVKGTFEQ